MLIAQDRAEENLINFVVRQPSLTSVELINFEECRRHCDHCAVDKVMASLDATIFLPKANHLGCHHECIYLPKVLLFVTRSPPTTTEFLCSGPRRMSFKVFGGFVHGVQVRSPRNGQKRCKTHPFHAITDGLGRISCDRGGQCVPTRRRAPYPLCYCRLHRPRDRYEPLRRRKCTAFILCID